MLYVKLNHKIQVYRPVIDKDDYGHNIDGEELVLETFANVRPTGSNERLLALQMQSGQTHVITARYSKKLAEIRGDCWVVLDKRRFDIIGVGRNFDESNKWLIFDAQEIAS